MVKVTPKLYRKYVTTNAQGTPVLYVQLEKAVYGMMKSALLFYCKLVADLLSLDFEINPYDPCVANKIINDKQMTICWHVDDLFIGHVDPIVVTSFLDWLAQRYDTDDKKLNVIRGHKHDYLGMNLDFSTTGEVQIDMIPYIKKISEAFPEKITGCNLLLLVIVSFKFDLLPRRLSYLKNKPGLSTTRPHNFFFYHAFVGTSKLRSHS
jgi:hypothetical protein